MLSFFVIFAITGVIVSNVCVGSGLTKVFSVFSLLAFFVVAFLGGCPIILLHRALIKCFVEVDGNFGMYVGIFSV